MRYIVSVITLFLLGCTTVQPPAEKEETQNVDPFNPEGFADYLFEGDPDYFGPGVYRFQVYILMMDKNHPTGGVSWGEPSSS